MNKSLEHFYTQEGDANLDNCDREKIHLSGMVQSVAAILILDPERFDIVGASENIEMFFNQTSGQLIGQRLEAIHKELLGELAALPDAPNVQHDVLDTCFELDSGAYDLITHVHGGFRFVEFIPNNSPSAQIVRKRLRICSKACTQIMNSEQFSDALTIAAEAVRQITGFERAKIYKFLPDWSGAVVGESHSEDVPSYMGLHFPAGDIPVHVREMMRIVPYRFIGTVTDDSVPIATSAQNSSAIDLTWSMARSVSVMHTAYLRNMGVRASFSCSLKLAGKLWGIIACHSTQDQVVPVDSWNLVQEVGNALMMRIDQAQRLEAADMITSLRKIENEFASELRREGNVEDVIAAMVPALQTFLRADGFAFQYGNKLHTSGDTPPPEFIRQVVTWAQSGMKSDDQFQNSELHRLFPEARKHIDTACGILIQPIVTHRVCQLVWFRGPITRRVEWAGRPNSKVIEDRKTGVVLGPRTSFDSWVQEHSDQSMPWEAAELEVAREIFKEFLDIIASQVLLKQENEQLRQFAYAAAHDIKAPLRGIQYALEWMEEDADDAASVEGHRALARVAASKLETLTEALLELSIMQEQSFEPTEVDLNHVLKDVHDLLASEVKACGAQVHFGALPKTQGSRHLLTRLFLNLVSNALKYRHADQAPRIEISCAQLAPVVVTVTDNGPGIEPKYAERIFEPTQRLVADDVAEGSGLGLSITRRIAEMHNGSVLLDTAYIAGASFKVELPRAERIA